LLEPVFDKIADIHLTLHAEQ